MSNQDKLIVALDVSTAAEAQKLVQTLWGQVHTFKVGKELFTSAGPDIVRAIHDTGGKVFLDLKFHDIPNTVGAACEAAARMGVFMLNVHCSGGKGMMVSAVQAVNKVAAENKEKPVTIVLGVTVLTSITDHDLKDIGVAKKVAKQVESLAVLAKDCGLDGVVASGQEIKIIRKAAGPDFLIVTPGVRPVWAAHGDQKRIVTPKEAIDAGASYIVVGRPITQAKDPREAAATILEEIAQ
jgi:orotidine-5'-phosphate decarboxylase